MRQRLFALSVFGGVALAAGAAADAAVVITSRTAQLVSGAGPLVNPTYSNTSLTPTGDFSDTHTEGATFTPPALGGYAFAEQESSVSFTGDVLNVTADGAVAGQGRSQGPAQNRAEAVSTLTISFNVTGVAADYTLSGAVLSTLPGGGPGTVNSGVNLTNTITATPVETFSGFTNSPNPTSFNVSGQLPVGSYTLNIFAVRLVPPGGPIGNFAAANYDEVEFTLTPVPEPGTLAVLGLASIPPLMRRRRRA